MKVTLDELEKKLTQSFGKDAEDEGMTENGDETEMEVEDEDETQNPSQDETQEDS